MTINSSNLKIKNAKKVDKNCDSSDYYYNNIFLFNEVDVYSKTTSGKVVNYQYFTQLSLPKFVAEKLAQTYNGYAGANDVKSNSYYIYFNNIDKAMSFINSEWFLENYVTTNV